MPEAHMLSAILSSKDALSEGRFEATKGRVSQGALTER
jgi:hypothetical protein